MIDGGSGDDTIVGDDGLLITPAAVGIPFVAETFTEQALGLHNLLRDLEHVTVDFDFAIQEAHRNVIHVLVNEAIANNPNQKKPKESDIIDPDHHDLILRNDLIVGGTGDDVIAGDDGVFVLPLVTSKQFREDRRRALAINKNVKQEVKRALKQQQKDRNDQLRNHIKNHHDDVKKDDDDVKKDDDDVKKDDDDVKKHDDDVKKHDDDVKKHDDDVKERLPRRKEINLIPFRFDFDNSVGNDVIDGQQGDDGSDGGNDLMFGGQGNDIMFGQQGRDEIHGDGGDDKIFGGKDKDTLDGGDGKNKVKQSGGPKKVDTDLDDQNPWFEPLLRDVIEAVEQLDPNGDLWLSWAAHGTDEKSDD